MRVVRDYVRVASDSMLSGRAASRKVSPSGRVVLSRDRDVLWRLAWNESAVVDFIPRRKCPDRRRPGAAGVVWMSPAICHGGGSLTEWTR